MRFFNTTDINKLLKQVAAEVINITYGETYFDAEGELLEAKVPGHNVYNIDSVEYAIVPNIGFIHILGGQQSTYQSLAQAIEAKYHEMFRVAATKFGMPKIPIASSGTTQYIAISQPSITSTPGVVKFVQNARCESVPPGFHFLWNISSDPIPVSYYTKGSPTALYSLSSIVIDTSDTIQLANGFKSPDYPSYEDYKIAKKGNLQVEPVDFHPNYGIHRELAKHYPDVYKGQKKLLFSKCSRPIRLVKWDWLKPYSINSEAAMDWQQQIRMGLFDTEPSEEVNQTCIVTNMPIYDDCYVFDIYERNIEETIDEKDLPKYPNAVIIPDSDSEPDSKDVDGDAEEKSTKKKATKKKATKKKVVHDSDEEDNASDDRAANSDGANSEEDEEDSSTKKKKKACAKTVKKAVTKTTKKEKDLPKPKTIIRRGAKEPTKMVKIVYTKKYDTPKCVLISPYYVHLCGYLDAVANFEKITKTKVMVYRTRSPVSVTEIIDNSNAQELTKTILHALYREAYFKDYNGFAIPSDIKFKLGFQGAQARSNSATLFIPDTNVIASLYSSIQN